MRKGRLIFAVIASMLAVVSLSGQAFAGKEQWPVTRKEEWHITTMSKNTLPLAAEFKSNCDSYGVGTKYMPTDWCSNTNWYVQGGVVTEKYYVFAVFKGDDEANHIYFANRSTGIIEHVFDVDHKWGHMNTFFYTWGTHHIRIQNSGCVSDETFQEIELSKCKSPTEKDGHGHLTNQSQVQDKKNKLIYTAQWDSDGQFDQEVQWEKDTNAIFVESYETDEGGEPTNLRLTKTFYIPKDVIDGEIEDISIDGNTGEVYLFFNLTHNEGQGCAFYVLNGTGMAMVAQSRDKRTWAENNFKFYNPDELCGVGGAINGPCGGDITATGTYDRLREVTEKYGILAMRMQQETGVPWEIVFSQMMHESSVGSSSNGVDHSVKELGYFNWLGLSCPSTCTNSHFYNIEDVYKSPKGSTWSMYSSIENMIAGYFIDYLRNGLYGAAFKYADMNNFNLEMFFRTMLTRYCPVSDGCDHDRYWDATEKTLEIIHEVAAEKGWPTSEQLAKQNKIPIGGKYPDVNSNIHNDPAFSGVAPHSLNMECSGGDGPTTAAAAATPGAVSVNVTWADGWITGGIEGYVKESAVDKNFHFGDSSHLSNYLTHNAKDGNTVGPNKILLHNTEGTDQGGTSGLALYPTKDEITGKTTGGFPAHFTVNLKEKVVYQHHPITKPSNAIASYDTTAGVQIEIIGYSTEKNKDSEWYLLDNQKFTNAEWIYLAKLLTAISQETGIPLTTSVSWDNPEKMSSQEFASYKGVLGHMHAPTPNDHHDPGNIWPMVEEALKSVSAAAATSCNAEKPATGEFTWWDQCDDRWGGTSYGGCGTTCSSGCGVVSFAMMATALTGIERLPDEVTKNAGSKGLHVCGAGSSHSLPATLAPDYGLVAESAGGLSADELSAKLREGYMIWGCGKGSNPYTSGGHCIGIRGITPEGKWLLADSNGEKGRTNSLETEWDPSEVLPPMNGRALLKKQ